MGSIGPFSDRGHPAGVRFGSHPGSALSEGTCSYQGQGRPNIEAMAMTCDHPDLLPLEIENSWLSEIASAMPELPEARKNRFINQYQLTEETAKVLTRGRYFADFFEKSAALFSDPVQTANWMAGDISRLLNANNLELKEAKLTPKNLAELLKLIDQGQISGKIGKQFIETMLLEGKPAAELVKQSGLTQISDESKLRELAKNILADSPEAIKKYKAGKTQALGFLVGEIMKATRGAANPKLVNQILISELDQIN